jgi:hypothetical protein
VKKFTFIDAAYTFRSKLCQTCLLHPELTFTKLGYSTIRKNHPNQKFDGHGKTLLATWHGPRGGNSYRS